MKEKIGEKIYDTEKATAVGHQSNGYYGDDAGFEETLYLKDKKEFFLYAVGGSESQYPAEKIFPLELADASEWLNRVTGEMHASAVLAGLDTKTAVPAAPAAKKAVKAAATQKAPKAKTAPAAKTAVKSAPAPPKAPKTAAKTAVKADAKAAVKADAVPTALKAAASPKTGKSSSAKKA